MVPELYFIFPLKKNLKTLANILSLAQLEIFMIAQNFQKVTEIFCSTFCLDLNVGKRNDYKEHRLLDYSQ